jgi:hypothetical protein
MANNKIRIKRTSVTGRTPNTTNSGNSQYIDAGELALNLTDKKLFSSNGSTYFEVGSNVSTLAVNAISANGTIGTAGQVLTSNGSVVYWDTLSSGGITVRSTAGNGGTVNTTVTNVTAINFDTVTGFNVTDQGSGNVFVSLGSGFKTIEVAGQTSITAVGEDTLVIANGSNITLTTSNAAPKTLTIALSANVVTNTQLSSNLANYQTTAGLSANVATLTANNTSYVGSVSAANVVSNAQLSANLANYQTTAGLAANVATLAANSATYLGSANNFGNSTGIYTTTAVAVGNSTAYSNVTVGRVLITNGTYTSSVNTSYLKLNANTDATLSNGVVISGNFLQNEGSVSQTAIGAAIALGTPGWNGPGGSDHYAPQGGIYEVGANLFFVNTSLMQMGNSVSYFNLTPTSFTMGNTVVNTSTITVKSINANGGIGSSGQVLTANGTGIYWSTPAFSVNVDAQYTWTNTQTFSNTITFSQTINGTANNSLYLGGTAAAGYQTTAGLSANVATLTANNTSYVGSVSAANVVSNAQLSSNLANYQTTAGLAANVAILTANNANNLGGVAAASYVNTSGTYTISGVHTYSANIHINNDKKLKFQTVNTSVYAAFSQQSDDNFVFYTSNTTYGSRPVWAIYANSDSSNLSILVPTVFNTTAYVGAVSANGSLGSAGQLLTSNGSATYWSSPGAVSVNTAAQYTWTNTQTFSSNITFSGNGITFTTNTGAVYFNGLSDSNWKIGRNTGGLTKSYYTGNTLDIIAYSSSGSLEGIALGQTGANVWFETGYNGSYTKNPIYVGNSSVNVSINSTSFTGTANNTSYVGTVSAANVVSNAQLTSNLANYQTTAGLSANVATLTANNTSFVGSVSAANVVSNSQLSANLANYQTTAGLSANVATLTANNTSYVGTVSAANVVSNAQLSGNLANYVTTTNLTNNLANYQTTAGLSANVATLTANNTSFVGSVSAANVVSNAQLTANLANYQTTAGLSANVATLTANNTSFVGSVSAANVVSNAQLTSNLANYQTTAGLAANVAILTANNANNLGGVAAASYVNTSGSYTITGVHTYNANIVVGTTAGISANGGYGTSGQVLTSNGTTVYWSTASSGGFSNGQSISVNNFVITGAFTANGANGSSGQVLTTNGSATYWSTPSSGSTTFQAVQQQYTGDGTTTTFSVSGGYVANNLNVYLNGVMLRKGTEVTVTSGSTFTVTTAPPSGSLIDAIGVSALLANGINTIVSQQFTANGTANSFTVSGGYMPNQILVFLNGVKQIPGTDVTITSGNTVNFAVTPANTYVVDVYGYQSSATVILPDILNPFLLMGA